jgi:1-deoxyxylulose-5-phosphate synthase
MKGRVPPPKAPHLLRSRRQVLSALALGLGPGACLGREGPEAQGSNTGGIPSGGISSGGAGSGGLAGPGGSPAAGGAIGSGGVPGAGGLLNGKLGRSVTDQVELGSTGIRISRLAMGSGTHGSGGQSDQTRLGPSFPEMLVQSYERGITFWETADQYGAHDEVAVALAQVGRKNIVVLTKSHAQTSAEMEADLMRFLQELGTDYIDVLLLHNKQSASWTTECEGAMEYLEIAKQKGIIRAHGVSCHTRSALELALETPWVEVDLARINPFGMHMDADPATVISILDQMKKGGKGVIGMKILGQGDAVGRFDEAIEHATRLDSLSGFTIGFTSPNQIDEVAVKVASV